MPRRVVDTLVAHFHSFVNDERELPVLWHQCLLTFVQRCALDNTVRLWDASAENCTFLDPKQRNKECIKVLKNIDD